MSRIFDTWTSDVQQDYLESLIAYAKKDIADNNFEPGETAESIGALYGASHLIAEADFSIISVTTVVAWYGNKPPRPPKP